MALEQLHIIADSSAMAGTDKLSVLFKWLSLVGKVTWDGSFRVQVYCIRDWL